MGYCGQIDQVCLIYACEVYLQSREHAKLYIDEIVRCYGIPLSNISDRGSQFTSHFLRSIQKSFGTQVKLSTTFHPQTYGHAERTILTLEDMLRVCVIVFRGYWYEHLPVIEFSYNNSYHSNIGMALFEVLHCRRYTSPVGWFKVRDSSILGPDIIHETLEKVTVIRDIFDIA